MCPPTFTTPRQAVSQWRVEEWIEPDGVHSEALHIIEFADDAFQVTYAIAVGIAECLGIDLVKHGVFRPFRHFGDFILARDCLCGCRQRQCRDSNHNRFFDVVHILLLGLACEMEPRIASLALRPFHIANIAIIS